MRVHLLLIALLTLTLPAVAQPEVSFSEPFEEPTWGWDKVLQLENGNTFYFHYASGEMTVKVYGKDHKLKSEKGIDGENWKAKRKWRTTINALYEIGGEPVVFLSQQSDRTPHLFRLRFNADDGSLKEERKLHEMDAYGAGAGYAIAMGGVDPKAYYVEKDPNSDTYAVVCYNSFAKESARRLEVLLYSGSHQEIGKAYYGDPGTFKYLKPVAGMVHGEATYLAVYGYNTEHSGGKDSRIIISRLAKGEKELAHNLLEMTDDFSTTKGIMRYNSGSKKIQLLTCTLLEDKKARANRDGVITRYQFTMMHYIDIASLDLSYAKVLKFEKLSEYLKENMDPGVDIGPPQDMFIDPDYTTTIVTEELYHSTSADTRSTTSSTTLGTIGITELNPEGEELFAIALPKKHHCFGYVDIFSHAAKAKGYWQYLNTGIGFSSTGYQDENFFSFDYIHTGNNRYLLYNNLPSNFDKDNKEYPETLSPFHTGHLVGHTFGKSRAKYYICGQPEGRDYRTVSAVQSSHYLRSGNSYATIIFQKEGRKKQCRLAWFGFN